MIELGEKRDSGIHEVVEVMDGRPNAHLGDIVLTFTGMWLAIPQCQRNLPPTEHKVRRDAISKLRDS